MLRTGAVCVVGVLLVTNALAANAIHQWAGDPNAVQIYGVDTLVVRAPGTFGFEALDPNGPAGLGYFQEISVDPNCPTGTINLYIARDPSAGGGPGATDVYYLALLNAPNVTVNIAEMRVSQTLPHVSSTGITGPIAAGATIGNISVGWLAGDITCSALGDVWVDSGITGHPLIAVDGNYAGTMYFLGDLPAINVTGDVTGNIMTAADADDSLTVDGDLAGLLEIAGTCDPNITLQLGSLSGTVSISTPFGATLDVVGNVSGGGAIILDALAADGLVEIGGSLLGLLDVRSELAGTVEFTAAEPEIHVSVATDVTGTIRAHGSVAGDIEVDRDFAGVLQIDENLHAGLEVGRDITEDGQLLVGESVDWNTSGHYQLHVERAMNGLLDVGADFDGSIYLGSLGSTGRVQVAEDMYWLGYLEMALRVANDVSGTIVVGNDFRGRMHVSGSVTEGAEIQIGHDAFILPLTIFGGILVEEDLNGSLSVGHDLRTEIRVTGDIGSAGEISVMNDAGLPTEEEPDFPSIVVVGDIDGLVTAGGDLMGVFDLGPIRPSGRVEVGGEISADPGLIVEQVYGSIAIGGDVSGEIRIGYLESSGSVTVSQSVPGEIWCNDRMAGNIAVGADVLGLISVAGPQPRERIAQTGSITVGGNVHAGGRIEAGDLSDPYDPNDPNSPAPLSGGYIIVNGSLLSGPDDLVASIYLHGGFAGNTEFITINYSGAPAEYWDPNCAITLAHGDDIDEVFYGNSPANRVWEISDCKADMNNNGFVSSTDTNGFIAALVGAYGYSVGWPGLGGTAGDNYLGGSRLFHADLNCDGYVTTQGDLNPFVTRLSQGCCIPECGECPGDSLGEWPDAETLAAQLEASISPELLDDFLSILEQYINGPDDPPERAFWLAVYEALIA